MLVKDAMMALRETLSPGQTVGEIMQKDFLCVAEETPLLDAWAMPQSVFPVLDAKGTFCGLLSREMAGSFLLDPAVLMVEQLITLLDSVHNGIIAINTEGVITLFNRAAEKITGRSKSEALGRHLTGVINSPELLEVI